MSHAPRPLDADLSHSMIGAAAALRMASAAVRMILGALPTLARLKPALSAELSSLSLPAVDSSFLFSTARSRLGGARSTSSLK